MINKVLIMGNLGVDPEVVQGSYNKPYTKISVATNHKWTDPSGQKHVETDWHTIRLYGKLGETANTYLKKGRSVYIEGKLRYGMVEGKKYSYIQASDMTMMGGPKTDSTDSDPSVPSYNDDDFDNDIPFN